MEKVTIKLNDLKKAAKELNEVLGLEPSIDVKQPEESLKAAIKEAITMLEEGEEDDLTPVTRGVYQAIKDSDEEEVEEEVEEVEEVEEQVEKEENLEIPKDGDLEDMVNSCKTIEQLKELIKTEETFKVLRKGIQFAKDPDTLRQRMLVALNNEKYGKEEPAEKPEKATAAKKEVEANNKQKPAKAGKTETKEKGKGIIATIVEILQTTKTPLSREDIHQKLVAKFPEHNEKSLMNTVRTQVPGRVHKEKFSLKAIDGKYIKE